MKNIEKQIEFWAHMLDEAFQKNDVYEPPYTLDQIKKYYPKKIYDKLSNCPIHRWRANTGIELIHKEPTEEELDRIWKNWQLMPQDMKDVSDQKSNELFGCTNAEHYKKLKHEYVAKRFNNIFDLVVDAYADVFGIDVSYMKFKVDSQPVYTNGEPCYEYSPDECAGDWTKLGWIRLNPDMKSVIERYGLSWHDAKDVDDFTKIIVAHELAHEVWNNIANEKFKENILQKAKNEGFTTSYLKTVRPSKIDEETFCEYIANQVIKANGAGMCNEDDIANNEIYLSNMAKSFGDKAWFLKYVPYSIDTIVDFGGGTGEFASYCQKKLPRIKYAIVDNNQSFLSQAQKNGFVAASSLDELRSKGIDFSKSLLILSSVIHEIYSYADPFYDDVGVFWSDVKRCGFKCIALRDMSYDEKAMKSAPVDAILWVYENILKSPTIEYKGIPFKDITDSFEEVWGAICDVKQHKVDTRRLFHFLIKYRYQENWSREVQEDYLPVSQKKLAKWLTSFMPYSFVHKESSKLEFYHECWAKDLKLKRPDNMHYKQAFLDWLKTLNTHIKWFLEK